MLCSVGKTVCLCLTTSYIALPQGFESHWRHASKYIEWWKNISLKIPKECMSGLTVPAGLRLFHRVFPGQPRTTLAFLHLKTVVQKYVYRSRIACSDVDSVSLFVANDETVVWVHTWQSARKQNFSHAFSSKPNLIESIVQRFILIFPPPPLPPPPQPRFEAEELARNQFPKEIESARKQ